MFATELGALLPGVAQTVLPMHLRAPASPYWETTPWAGKLEPSSTLASWQPNLPL